MKKGEIILGTIALVVTVGSTVAFKVTQWTSHHPTYVIHGSACYTCLFLYTHWGTLNRVTSCFTKATNPKVLGAGPLNWTFYTKNNCPTKSATEEVSFNL